MCKTKDSYTKLSKLNKKCVNKLIMFDYMVSHCIRRISYGYSIITYKFGLPICVGKVYWFDEIEKSVCVYLNLKFKIKVQQIFRFLI